MNKNKLTILLITLFLISNLYSVETQNENSNPILAMGLSALIPGFGQIYNGDWERGLIYLGLEIAAINKMNYYNDSANNYTEDYEVFAQTHWSLDTWLRDFYVFSNPDNEVYPAFIDGDDRFQLAWEYSHGPHFYLNENYYNTSSDDFRYEYINECSETFGEDGYLNDNYNFTSCDLEHFIGASVIWDHHLYEGLGKYNEFFAGWNDTHTAQLDEVNGTPVALTDNKNIYQTMRNKANSEFDRKEIYLSFIFLNHAVSMFDAFITSVFRMKDISFSSKLKHDVRDASINGLEVNVEW